MFVSLKILFQQKHVDSQAASSQQLDFIPKESCYWTGLSRWHPQVKKRGKKETSFLKYTTLSDGVKSHWRQDKGWRMDGPAENLWSLLQGCAVSVCMREKHLPRSVAAIRQTVETSQNAGFWSEPRLCTSTACTPESSAALPLQVLMLSHRSAGGSHGDLAPLGVFWLISQIHSFQITDRCPAVYRESRETPSLNSVFAEKSLWTINVVQLECSCMVYHGE